MTKKKQKKNKQVDAAGFAVIIYLVNSFNLVSLMLAYLIVKGSTFWEDIVSP